MSVAEPLGVVAGRPIDSSIRLHGWAYYPLVEEDAVSGFVAIAEDESAPVRAVLCEASDTGAGIGTWALSAWDGGPVSGAVEAAVAYVADATGTDRDTAARIFGGSLGDPSVVTDPATIGDAPTALARGIASDDPLQAAVAGASDPHLFLEALAATGYAALPSLSMSSTTDPATAAFSQDPCLELNAGGWLSLAKLAYDAALADPTITPPQEVLDLLDPLLACCTPFTMTLPPTNNPWPCGAWDLEASTLNIEFCLCDLTYQRGVSKQDLRVQIQQDANCVAKWCVQTQTCFGTQQDTCFASCTPTVPPGGTCDGAACTPSLACGKPNFGNTICTTWTPLICP